ncbi:hypothetical protein [Novosphingobium sp.]|uniref:hypothetical protein n=1 Tax=Novosphingobium sp. TaxID=1874826 RepID=UPI00286DE512|nr:hypothetical protein [Novosphingobium sp.]
MKGHSGWTVDSCMTCRGQAWRGPDGSVHCPDCEAKAERLAALMASVANPPAFLSLRSALLGSSAQCRPVMVPGT